nr:uncharacterized protein LOC122273820 [Parasteatoda tepidariorum]
MNINRCVRISISNKDKSFEKELTFLVVEKIIDFTPSKFLNAVVKVPVNVRLADETFFIPDKIDVLLGAEIFYELLRSGQIYLHESKLILQNTVFGYVASGSYIDSHTTNVHCGLILEDDLNKTLKSFWEVENLDVGLTKSKETTFCEEYFEQTHFRNKEGRYVVTIPLKEEPSCLGESRDIALKRLNSLWYRLSKDQEHLRLCKNFLDEYERLGHLSEVKDEGEPESSYYMPHHGLYRPEKSTTKLRVVFNASSLTHNATPHLTLSNIMVG